MQALQRAGLTPYAVLEATTRSAAEYLGRADDLGTIAIRRRADLRSLDADPPRDVANVERVAGVMVGGRWVPGDLIASYLEQVAATK